MIRTAGIFSHVKKSAFRAGAFPEQPSGYGTATHQLAQYALNKVAGISCRLRGSAHGIGPK